MRNRTRPSRTQINRVRGSATRRRFAYPASGALGPDARARRARSQSPEPAARHGRSVARLWGNADWPLSSLTAFVSRGRRATRGRGIRDACSRTHCARASWCRSRMTRLPRSRHPRPPHPRRRSAGSASTEPVGLNSGARSGHAVRAERQSTGGHAVPEPIFSFGCPLFASAAPAVRSQSLGQSLRASLTDGLVNTPVGAEAPQELGSLAAYRRVPAIADLRTGRGRMRLRARRTVYAVARGICSAIECRACPSRGAGAPGANRAS